MWEQRGKFGNKAGWAVCGAGPQHEIAAAGSKWVQKPPAPLASQPQGCLMLAHPKLFWQLF